MAKKTRKTAAHTIYKLADGTRVPGATTITGILNKPALVPWANKLGLDGIEVGKYVDDLADVGTLAHKMVEDYVAGRETDFSEFTPAQKDRAENAVLKFYEWERQNEIEYIGNEMILVSEEHRYGGQCDLYCVLNGKKTLIDLKTGKAIYSEHHTQVAGYRHLLTENGYEVEDVRILRIGRDEGEGFDDIAVPRIDAHWRRFVLCREVYEINKELRRK